MPDAPLSGEEWPLVSIVTPSYNQGQYIEETIRSVLLQGYPRVEYFIFDGGSSDDSVDIIRRYEPWLAYWVSQPDRGQTSAVNAGWARATGAVLAYLNTDDTYLPGAIGTAVEAFRSAPGAGLVYGTARVVDESGRQLRTWKARPFSLSAMLTQGNVVPQPASFYAHSALERVGYLAERWEMIMDYDLSIRVGLAFPSVDLPRTISQFRDHGQSKSRTRFDAIAGELARYLHDLDLDSVDHPPAQLARMKQTALARVEYEWALARLGHRPRDARAAARHLRRSLRLDGRYALRRPRQTAYLLKELLRRSTVPAAKQGTVDV